jgi:CubicO group peptidase (beta-lactamase class C family)
MKLLSLIAAAALAFAGFAQAAPSTADQAAIAALEAHVGTAAAPKTLSDRMAELKVPGLSVAFIENGQVKWAMASRRRAGRRP